MANQLNFLCRVGWFSLLTEYARTKDIKLLEEACNDLATLTARERFIEQSDSMPERHNRGS